MCLTSQTGHQGVLAPALDFWSTEVGKPAIVMRALKQSRGEFHRPERPTCQQQLDGHKAELP